MNQITKDDYAKKLYKEYYFWENKIIKESPLWKGHFNNIHITTNSKFIYTGILDTNKNILKHGWAVYPNIYTLLGFIQHVFLPTAFFTWFDNSYSDFSIPLSSFTIVVNEVKKYIDSKESSIIEMENDYKFLDSLWNFDKESITLKLNKFCKEFNAKWDDDPNKKLFIKVFNHSSDIFNFIKDSLLWEFEEFIEEEISMSLETLKFTCENSINSPLLNKNFINILNNNIPILF